MTNEFTPEEQQILAESPADSPVLMDDDASDGDDSTGGGADLTEGTDLEEG